MRLYFFGGTFNPPHIGHYSIVKHCLNKCDKLIVIPNNSPVNKNPIEVCSKHRLNMLKILFSDLDIIIDDYEIQSLKKNYTFYTIEYLLKKYSNFKISMVIGNDQALDFHNWYRNDDIKNMVDVLCFNRKVLSSKSKIDGFKYIPNFNIDISSTKIRRLLKDLNLTAIQKYIDPRVFDYIRKNGLYV